MPNALIRGVESVVRTTSASKGMEMNVLLIVVIGVIIAAFIFILFASQTDFIQRAAMVLSNLLVVKLP